VGRGRWEGGEWEGSQLPLRGAVSSGMPHPVLHRGCNTPPNTLPIQCQYTPQYTGNTVPILPIHRQYSANAPDVTQSVHIPPVLGASAGALALASSNVLAFLSSPFKGTSFEFEEACDIVLTIAGISLGKGILIWQCIGRCIGGDLAV